MSENVSKGGNEQDRLGPLSDATYEEIEYQQSEGSSDTFPRSQPSEHMCSVTDCQITTLPLHTLCAIHTGCLKNNFYDINSCTICSSAFKKVASLQYDEAKLLSEWKFLLTTFWTIEATRERLQLVPQLQWNRDAFLTLFPNDQLIGDDYNKFRMETFPDLSSQEALNLDFDKAMRNFNMHVSREIPPISEPEVDPLDEIPAHSFSSSSLHYVDLPPSWTISINPDGNGELIAMQKCKTAEGEEVFKQVPNILIKKYVDINKKSFFKFCTTSHETPRTKSTINPTDLNINMSCISSFVSAFDSSADTCTKGSKTSPPIFDLSNSSLSFLPSEKELEHFWDTIVLLGDSRVEPITKPTSKLELKFPENSFSAKFYAFLDQKKFVDSSFSPSVFKKPSKTCLDADFKAGTRALTAFHTQCMLDRLTYFLHTFCKSGNNSQKNAVNLLEWSSKALDSINVLMSKVTSDLVEESIKSKIKLRKEAILYKQRDLSDKLCMVDKFSPHPLASVAKINEVIAARPLPSVLAPSSELSKVMIQTMTVSRSNFTSHSGNPNRGRGGNRGQYNANRNSSYKRKNEPQAGPSGYVPNKARKPNPTPSPNFKQEDNSDQKFRNKRGRGRGGRK